MVIFSIVISVGSLVPGPPRMPTRIPCPSGDGAALTEATSNSRLRSVLGALVPWPYALRARSSAVAIAAKYATLQSVEILGLLYHERARRAECLPPRELSIPRGGAGGFACQGGRSSTSSRLSQLAEPFFRREARSPISQWRLRQPRRCDRREARASPGRPAESEKPSTGCS